MGVHVPRNATLDTTGRWDVRIQPSAPQDFTSTENTLNLECSHVGFYSQVFQFHQKTSDTLPSASRQDQQQQQETPRSVQSTELDLKPRVHSLQPNFIKTPQMFLEATGRILEPQIIIWSYPTSIEATKCQSKPPASIKTTKTSLQASTHHLKPPNIIWRHNTGIDVIELNFKLSNSIWNPQKRIPKPPNFIWSQSPCSTGRHRRTLKK